MFHLLGETSISGNLCNAREPVHQNEQNAERALGKGASFKLYQGFDRLVEVDGLHANDMRAKYLPAGPGLGGSVASPYGRCWPKSTGIAIVTGTVAANGKELALVTTASTV